MQVKVCIQAWTLTTFRYSHSCMQKGQTHSRTINTNAQKWTCIYTTIWGVWRQQTKRHTSKHAQVLHTVFLSLSGRVGLQCFGRRPLTFLGLWNRDSLPLLDTFCTTEFFLCRIRCTFERNVLGDLRINSARSAAIDFKWQSHLWKCHFLASIKYFKSAEENKTRSCWLWNYVNLPERKLSLT